MLTSVVPGVPDNRPLILSTFHNPPASPPALTCAMVIPAADKPSRSSGPHQSGGGCAFRGRVPPPPRDLNLHKFAEARARELESLHAVVATRTGGEYHFPRGKRRRTTSFDARIARRRLVGNKKRRLRGAVVDDGGGATGKEKDVKGDGERENKGRRPPPRWVRRKAEFRANPTTGYVVSADGTRRLRTHLWLTKRFEMVKRWGFFLPLGLLGRGRGSKAMLKWFKTESLLHDASYCYPVEINGPKDSILAVLKSILIPSPSDLQQQNSRHVICGVQYGRALLHHSVESTSEFIAPVMYMWRPSIRNSKDCSDTAFGCVRNGVEANAESGADESYCQLWIWIHAAAFDEGFGAIKDACTKKTDENGDALRCLSHEGELCNFEIIGFKAIDILKKYLRPIDKCTQFKDATGLYPNKCYILEHAEDIPHQTILSLEIHDPRDLPSETVKPLGKASETGEPLSEPESTSIMTSDDQTRNADAFVSDDLNESKKLSSMWANPEESASFLSDSKDLWGFHKELKSPREEKALCSEKHMRRLKHFYMDGTSRNQPHTEENENTTSCCPVLLLKHHNQRWSIIFPLSWARAFWVPLVSGTRAIGLRERHWIACESGLPSFPSDFPDCKAYSLSMAVDAAALDKDMQLRPASMRPLKIPIPPPWHCLTLSLQESPLISHNVDIRSTSDLYFKNSDATAAKTTVKGGFGGSVIRTRDGLVQLISKTNISNSLLFPCDETRSLQFSDLIKNENLRWIPKTSISGPVEPRPVYLRVILCPFKEGTFEEGAVVCAPTLSDIELWRSRTEVLEEPLQIAQAWMNSYFVERGPGEWILQMPTDPSSLQSHRWPIGFVTTGSVHRSSRLVAHALCEATLLAQLRGQQWSEMQSKSRPEIFVLVRNLRSTAYRLALASVVLEQRRDDLDFM